MISPPIRYPSLSAFGALSYAKYPSAVTSCILCVPFQVTDAVEPLQRSYVILSYVASNLSSIISTVLLDHISSSRQMHTSVIFVSVVEHSSIHDDVVDEHICPGRQPTV